MGVIAGPMVDAGWLRTLVFTSSFMVVFGMMMTSLVTEYYQVSNFFFFFFFQSIADFLFD